MTQNQPAGREPKAWTDYHTLLKKAMLQCIPQTAVVELTYRCNFRCVQCYVVHESQTERELTVAEYDSVFQQLASLGSLYVILTGGEIFLRKDFWEILDLTRKHRFAVHLFTNGYALTDRVVSRLDGYGNLLGLSISVYGGDRETFEAVTKIPGSFDRVMDGIRRLAAKGIRVRIKTPIISSNYCSLDQIREFCSELDLRYRSTPMITPRDDGSAEPVSYRIDDASLRDFLSKQYLAYLDDRAPDRDIPVCSAGRGQLAISPEGELYSCVQIRQSAGNVREKPIQEMWQSQAFDFIRNLTVSKVPECARCKLLKFCSPCYGLGWTEHGTVLKPSSESCRIARILAEVYEESKASAGRESR